MDDLVIRKAVRTDAGYIAGLVNRAYRPLPGTGGWTHESSLIDGNRIDRDMVLASIQTSTVLVGWCGHLMTGCVKIEMQGKAAYIGMLAVDPSHQISGIGKQLLQQAEKISAQKYHADIAVLIVIAARTELVEFYLRRGYRQTGQELPYPIDSGVGNPRKTSMPLTRLEKNLNYV